MRRLIPSALVGVLALATIGVALIGRSETPAGGPGAGGNAAAQAALSKAVRKTFASESLTMSLGQGFTLVYEDPDLTDTMMPFENVIQMGSHTLTKTSGQWFEDLPDGSLSGPDASFLSPSHVLSRLLHLPDLESKGAQTFVSKRVLAPSRTVHRTVTIIETVQAAHGFLLSVTTPLIGASRRFSGQHAATVRAERSLLHLRAAARSRSVTSTRHMCRFLPRTTS
jgi:hypothetical protein